jgi:hypothetical protein
MSAPRVPTVGAADPRPDRPDDPGGAGYPRRLRRPSAGRPARPPRRAELTAALGVAVVLVHLLFAQVTLVLLGCALMTGAVSRWRPLWLTVPAAAGATAAAAAGPARVLAGFTAGPWQLAAYLGGLPGHPARLARLPAAFAGAGYWLPRQLPLALLAAAAEAAILAWLGWPGGRAGPADREWPGGTGRYRPGLVIMIRRRLARLALAAGEVVTAEGASIGIDVSSGRRAEVTWAQAERGVLLTAADGPAAARAGFPLACAAVRRRKTVVVVDLSGSRWLAAALAAACAAADVPLTRFGAGGPGCYEPFRSYPPARAADLAARLIDWTGRTEPQRQAGRRCLADAFAVLAAAPPAGSVLDGLLALIEPGTLLEPQARPSAAAWRPGSGPAGAGSADADADTAAALAAQLHRLRASELGGWLRPAGPSAGRLAADSDPADSDPADSDPADSDPVRGGQARGDRAGGDLARADLAWGGRPGGHRAGGSRLASGRTGGSRAGGDPASADLAWGGRPGGHRAGGGRLGSGRAGGGRADGDLAGGSRAGGGRAGGRGSPGSGRPPEGDVRVRLAQAVRDRGCVLFSLGPEPDAAASGMVGRLALADLAAVLGDLSEQGLRGDCLAWVHGCEAADPPALARLAAAGPGTAVAMSTGSAAAAARLAGTAGVVVSSGPTEQRLAARLAELAPLRQEGGRQELAELLRWQDEDHFAVLAPGPQPRPAARFQPECRSVPIAWARPL